MTFSLNNLKVALLRPFSFLTHLYISGCCLFPNHTGTTHTHDQWRQLDLNSQTHKGHPPRTREEPLPAPLLSSDHRQSQRGERQDGKGKNRRGPSKIRKEENEISGQKIGRKYREGGIEDLELGFFKPVVYFNRDTTWQNFSFLIRKFRCCWV